MADEYFIPIYCILPKKCVVKEIFISEWRIGDVHGLTNNRIIRSGMQIMKNFRRRRIGSVCGSIPVTDAVMELYDRIVNPHLMVRRISMAANHVLDEKKAADKTEFRQLDLFTDFTGGNEKKQQDEKLEREKKMQEAVLSIKKKYGKNAILKGLNFQEGATTKARNEQIGGHKA